MAEPAAAETAYTAAGTRTMVDSAYPLGQPPPADIILIYVGGDTPHPWTDHGIAGMPARYRWPCWVRSDPQDRDGGLEAAFFAAWLHGHHVPMGCAVILDLEIAVNTVYVNKFNQGMRSAGYKTTKYGSQGNIWQNPKTDGGTMVALPGPAGLTTEGDTVATQYGFLNDRDWSTVKSQADLPLWDMSPPPPSDPFDLVKGWWQTYDLHKIAAKYDTTERDLIRLNPALASFTGTGMPVRVHFRIKVPAQ